MMLRPIRPNPLIPTLTAIVLSLRAHPKNVAKQPKIQSVAPGTEAEPVAILRSTAEDSLVSPTHCSACISSIAFTAARRGGLSPVLSLPGAATQQVRRQLRGNGSGTYRFVQSRRRRIDLGACGLGGRGAGRPAADF